MGKSGKAAAAGLTVVEMTGPDTRMDQFGSRDEPANPLPVKCPHCTMPDLDAVAEPYLLAKGFAAPAEHSFAEVGNFLVRERTRRILELVVPGACTFHPTAEKKSKKRTDWFLAVPARVIEVPGMVEHDPKRERCKKCGAPKLGYQTYVRGRHVAVINKIPAGVDVFKSKQWYAGQTAEDSLDEVNRYRKKEKIEPLPWSHYGLTPPPHPQRWTRDGVSRDLYFSVRLEQLLKKAKVKGQLVRLLDFEGVKPTDADLAWIDEKLALLAEHGLVDTPARKPANGKTRDAGTSRWFAKYLKKNAARRGPAAIDFAAIEKKHKVVLPQDYKDFISVVGEKEFEDVMEQDGFSAFVVPPRKMDFRGYRRGKMTDLLFDEESLAVDGVMFADTEHGDAFVFDLAQRDAAGNYAIYWYDHEGNAMEPFAPTFAACIRRFAERT